MKNEFQDGVKGALDDLKSNIANDYNGVRKFSMGTVSTLTSVPASGVLSILGESFAVGELASSTSDEPKYARNEKKHPGDEFIGGICHIISNPVIAVGGGIGFGFVGSDTISKVSVDIKHKIEDAIKCPIPLTEDKKKPQSVLDLQKRMSAPKERDKGGSRGLEM